MIVNIYVTGLAGFFLLAFCIFHRQRSRNVAAHQYSRTSVVRLPIKEPFLGLDAQFAMYKDIPSMHRHHQRYGKTLKIQPWVAPTNFVTVDPANIRAINTGKDWGVESMRLGGMEEFCGRGFLSTDGTVWQQSRKLLKPTFAKNNLQNLEYLSQQVDNMFSELPSDGATVDLQPLFFTMVR
jgi:cytochrome P450